MVRPGWTAQLGAVLAAAVVALAAIGRPGAVAAPPAGLQLTAVSRLGSEEGEGGPALGLVADIAVDGHGRTYVLDALLSRVAVFAPEGRPLGYFGGEGSGPGELRHPAAVDVDAGERAYVLDRGNARIAVYERGAVSRVLPLDFGAEDLCHAGGRLYVLGERGGFLIHELAPGTGAVLRSFAPDPIARDPLLRGSRVNGYLGCGPRDELAFLPLLLPEVRRYSRSSGALVGSDPIPGYRAVRIRRHGRSSVFEAPEGGRHHVGASVVAHDGGWLVQIGFLRPGAQTQHELEGLQSFVLRDGDGMRRVTGEPPRLLVIRAGRALAALSDPFPQVREFRLLAGSTER